MIFKVLICFRIFFAALMKRSVNWTFLTVASVNDVDLINASR